MVEHSFNVYPICFQNLPSIILQNKGTFDVFDLPHDGFAGGSPQHLAHVNSLLGDVEAESESCPALLLGIKTVVHQAGHGPPALQQGEDGRAPFGRLALQHRLLRRQGSSLLDIVLKFITNTLVCLSSTTRRIYDTVIRFWIINIFFTNFFFYFFIHVYFVFSNFFLVAALNFSHSSVGCFFLLFFLRFSLFVIILFTSGSPGGPHISVCTGLNNNLLVLADTRQDWHQNFRDEFRLEVMENLTGFDAIVLLVSFMRKKLKAQTHDSRPAWLQLNLLSNLDFLDKIGQNNSVQLQSHFVHFLLANIWPKRNIHTWGFDVSRCDH